MLYVKISDINNQEKYITINQKQICSFAQITKNDTVLTEVRMSNGDIWHVIEPEYNQWFPDSFITDVNY